jgi:predicted RecB family nuclease
MANRLSKSRFQTGLQCSKALWLSTHARELADATPDTQQHIFDTGNAVGELARERFANGVLVAEDYTQSAQALATTRRLLEDPPSAIFEAALEHGGVFVRPDALVRVADNLWDLYEVKSGTRVKDVNITDVAVQLWVLEGAGLPIRRAYLMHLDRGYVYEGGDYDLERLFIAEDVTAAARACLPMVPDLVTEMLAMLDNAEPPAVAIGKHCDSPYTCAFWDHCHEFLPVRPVTELPRISESLLDALIADGIFAIEDVPLDYPNLSKAQREVCELVRSGEPRIVGDVGRSLAGLSYPIHFLDFETFMSALPLYPGTHAWQMITFQWSDHILHQNGDLEHREFLHQGVGDPRPSFVTSLIETLGDSGSVVVYSPFENSRLNELALAYPDHAEAIAAIQTRIFDLLKTVRTHVRHPDCLGGSSIKVVLPALVKDLSYDGLGISDGNVASMLYCQAATGALTAEDCATVYADLREYCGTDTLAMVRLFEVLSADAR